MASDTPTRFQHLQRSTPDTVPFAPEGPPVPGEMRSQFLSCDGVRRRFVLYLPKGHQGETLPLLLNLHGSTSYPEEQMLLSDMAKVADRFSVAVLAPEALDRAWNVPAVPERPSDVTFVAAAIAAAAASAPLDPVRRFATGFSGGARMLSLLVAGLPEPLLAIAPVSGVRYADGCPEDRRPLVMAFHGTLDQVNPYEGGGFPYWKTDVEHAVDAWARHNGMDHEGSHSARVEEPAPHVRRTVHGEGDRRVELYRIDNLGHIWPGFPIPLGAVFDPPSTAVHASQVMLEAFTAL